MDALKNWFTSRKQTNLDEAFNAVYKSFKTTELKKVASKGIRNSNGLTLLHQAVLDDDLEKVKLLCDAGVDMYAMCQKKTALHMALLLHKSNIALALLENGCNPEHHTVSSQFYHPWHIVMTITDRELCHELTEMLVAFNADINREIRLTHQLTSNLEIKELNGMRVCRDFAPVIQLAIVRNDGALVENIIKGGADLLRTCNSCSALTRCLTLDISNRLAILEVLLKQDIDLNDAEELIHTTSDCSWDFTPLQICILCRRVETYGSADADDQCHSNGVLRLLLKHGADPDVSAGECKYQYAPDRPQPLLPVPIHEEDPCLYPLCLCVHHLWYEGVLALVKENCAVNWNSSAHQLASRTEHSSPILFAMTTPNSLYTYESILENSTCILQILHLLYEAGSDFFSMTDECVDQLHIFISKSRYHPLSQWFQHVLTTPQSLKTCTRIFIRKVLGPKPLKKCQELEGFIPRKIVSYIMFEDHLAFSAD